MPAIIARSIAILSDAGLGMAMFSLGMLGLQKGHFLAIVVQRLHNFVWLLLSSSNSNWFAGLFMALQPRMIACGNRIASFAMAVRFLAGPAVMAAASLAVGLRGVLLHIAIVQVSKFCYKLCQIHIQEYQIASLTRFELQQHSVSS